MKVLLDECVDGRLARDIVGHDVKTARQMDWTTVKNGALRTLASAHFDVFVTVDRNLSFQQNLDSFSIAVRDAGAEKHGLLRIVDESGDDYLYPKTAFRLIALPQAVKKAVLAA